MLELTEIRVLLVEDRAASLRTNADPFSPLHSQRMTLQRADSLAEAAEKLVTFSFDALLLDVDQADSIGIQTLHALRNLAPPLPIVVISGSLTDAFAIQAILAGAQEVLPRHDLRVEMLERALLHSIARYRASIDSSHPRLIIGGFTASLDGCITARGIGIAQLADTFQVNIAEPLHLSRFTHSSEHAHLETLLSRVSQAAEPEHAVLRAAEGMRHSHILLSLFPVEDGLQGIMLPAGDPVHLPVDLIHPDEKYKQLLKHSQDGVFIIIEGKLAFVNDRLASMLGYTPDEIMGHGIQEFVAPEDETFVLEQHSKRIEGEDVESSYEFRLRNREGHRLHISMSVGRIEFQNRVAAMGTVKDLTRERHMSDLFVIRKRIEDRVGACMSLQSVSDVVLGELLRIDNIDVASLLLHIDGGLKPLGFSGFIKDFIANAASVNTLSLLDDVRVSLSPLFLDKAALHAHALGDALCYLGISAAAVLPVVDTGESKAVLLVASLTDSGFDTDTQSALLTIASTLGGVIARVSAQDALSEREMLYRAVVDKSHDAILIFDGAALLFANERTSQVTGYSNAELLSLNPMALIHEEDRLRVMDYAKSRFFSSDVPSVYDARCLRRDGSVIFGEFAVSSIRYQGKPASIVTIRDVTERRQYEELKRHSEDLIRAAGFAATSFLRSDNWEAVLDDVLNNFGKAAGVHRVVLYQAMGTEDGSVSLMKHGAWMDPAAEALPDLALTPDLATHLPGWMERLSAGDIIAERTDNLPIPERQFLERDSIRSIAMLPVFAGDAMCAVLRFDDFSERRAWLPAELDAMNVCAGTLGAAVQRRLVDQQLITSRDRAERSDRIRQAFISNMSHEIRTPLNIIIGYLALLEDLIPEAGSEDYGDFSYAIGEASHRLIRTVDSVINISRYQAGDLTPAATSLRFDEFVCQRVEKIRALAAEKLLDVQCINEVGEVCLDSDPEFLREIIDNVLDNAVKFTARGNIRTRLFMEDHWIGFEVSDTGIGIANENINQIFEAYIQEDMGLSRAYEGLGLGLTISRMYASALGGTIHIRSDKGKGTMVTIRFPFVKSVVPDSPVFAS